MNDYDDNREDRDLALALRRLHSAAVVPDADPARKAALMAAFDAAQVRRGAPAGGRQYWYMAALATAAAALIVMGLNPALTGRRGSSPPDAGVMHKPQASILRGVQPGPEPPNEFVMVPGAATLPAMESGSLVRMDVPVSMLPSLGLMPPQTSYTASVRADLVVAQDGLPRAARLVN